MPILWVTASALSQEPSASTTEGMLQARARRRHTVLDLDYRPTFWRSREEASARIGAAVEHATIAVGNREECAVAVGTDDPREAAERLRVKGVELAIVKLGGDGVLLSSEQAERLLEPPPIEVVCGLGAGDAFGGALCHGLLSGGRTSARSRTPTRPAGSSPRGCCARRRCRTSRRSWSCSKGRRHDCGDPPASGSA